MSKHKLANVNCARFRALHYITNLAQQAHLNYTSLHMLARRLLTVHHKHESRLQKQTAIKVATLLLTPKTPRCARIADKTFSLARRSCEARPMLVSAKWCACPHGKTVALNTPPRGQNSPCVLKPGLLLPLHAIPPYSEKVLAWSTPSRPWPYPAKHGTFARGCPTHISEIHPISNVRTA